MKLGSLVYKMSKEHVAMFQKMAEVMNAKRGGGSGPTPILKTIAIPATEPTDPTPDQLLEWMKEQLELYAECRASGNWNDLPLHFIPRIIDTVKRVTG